jgi:pimeloyl-ACP methyl ester carboxylesterase
MTDRKQASLIGLGAGLIAGVGIATVKGLAFFDRKRSGFDDVKALEAAGSPSDPAGVQHHELRGTDGALLHVVDVGPSDAPTVVLLHGVTLSWEIWHVVIRALMTDHRVIAPDWRGHGRSTAGSKGYGLHLLADDLAAILKQLEVTDAVVVGHSMGGMALMRFCGDHSAALTKHVAGTVFLSTAAGDVIDGPGPAAFDSAYRWLVRKEKVARNASNVPPGDLGWAFVRYTFGVKPPAAAVELVRRVTMSMDPTATGRSVASLVDHDGTAALRALTVPAMVIVGDHDRVTPPGKSERIAELLPKRDGDSFEKLTVFEGGGHLIMLEQPENVVRLLRDFVKDVKHTH